MPLLSVTGLRVAVPDYDRLEDPFAQPVLVEPYGPFLPKQYVEVVRRFDLEIEPGETVGIVGESGSGKSLSILGALGIQSAGAVSTAGEVVYDDVRLRPTRDLERRRTQRFRRKVRKRFGFMEELRDDAYRDVMGTEIGVLFQHPNESWNPTRELGEQSGEVLDEHTTLSIEEIEQRVTDALGEVKLPSGVFRAFSSELSRGQAQRAMLASVLVKGPRLLIADEPTSGLDVQVAAAILQLLRDMQRERDMAMVLITHDLATVAAMASRVLVMYGGRIVEDGPVRQIFHHPRHPYTAGLLSSIPGTARRLAPIPGAPPDIKKIVDGSCAFAPRCAHAEDVCRQVTPPLTPTEDGAVACVRAGLLDLPGVRG
jgi:oligopeptide/dipeptide ABC transporter ATP-binding protein